MVIDSHQHFWHYTKAEYGWISSDLLRRDFLPADLRLDIAAAGVDGVIAVQARQTEAETRWLLNLSAEHDFIRGVVGWAPLIDPDIESMLGRYAANAKLRGIRHVLHDEPDDFYMLRDDFNHGVATLKQFKLCYDILIFERHLSQTIRFVDRHPEQTFILDHLGKPKIKAGEIEPWRTNLRELAQRPNVFCKLSGMVTEAGASHWHPEQLRPYYDVAIDAFGSARLMFGSDWPVLLDGCDYPRWVRTVRGWTDALSTDEQRDILGCTAMRAYGLEQ